MRELQVWGAGRGLQVDRSAQRLANFFTASVELMRVMARACGHDRLSAFNKSDLATWKRYMALLSGVAYSGLLPPSG